MAPTGEKYRFNFVEQIWFEIAVTRPNGAFSTYNLQVWLLL